LPAPLSRVNRRGAPSTASVVTSVVTGLVIAVFAIFQLDPVLNMFYWFSGLAVVSIVLIELLVCIAVIVYFNRNKGSENLFQTVIAPVLAAIGLVLGEYLLMSRFGLLAGTVAEGVDPTVTSWGLSPIGWVLVALPFALLAGGYVLSLISHSETEELVKDVLS
ncbi:MAG: APC family permease, partial [Terracoccus sp.]